MKVGYGWILLLSAARAFWIPSTLHNPSCRLTSSLSVRSSSSTSLLANNAGVYIHIPFCRRRCRYCDFAIVPVGSEDRTGFTQLNDQYTTALLHEITHHTSLNNNHTISSIYFGGGTPSLVPVSTLQAILEKLYGRFNVAPDCEISIEMDPGTFDFAKATALRDMGFNRVSLGVQSFNDTILESLGRIHRKNDVMNALKILQDVWGNDLNYSMDLISGLPGLSVAEWVHTLENVMHLQLRPNHLSLYDLQVEPGTVFGRWYSDSMINSISSSPVTTLPLPSDEEASFMYKYASGFLRYYGYDHYEVSSYATPGHQSQHNQVYWAVDGEWYAFGLGATSHINGQLAARPRTMADYLKWVYEPTVSLPSTNSFQDRLLDIVLKRLRTKEGLCLPWIGETFGSNYQNAIRRGAELGVELALAQLDEERGILTLTDPHGLLFSNSIISTIFAELETLPEWSTLKENETTLCG
ncbi:oxygen-independent coproporphyrinogen III oxidase [Fistulifera solaris]|uniref:Radical S-adenosyl methionine domain-containing protein 1, mitochondrial n=1 Tax=Fistulifera solaris TaxID=1519565 RepID=A0A1Z5K4D2_FISSO|nr:oxygen-independent coproporphyrinogen III oxidase [Fistulifera solaris]|eukprot:GAX21085.1 oxygen-independent coproporphyrinogen III oxidase [Fistulifera solaris]